MRLITLNRYTHSHMWIMVLANRIHMCGYQIVANSGCDLLIFDCMYTLTLGHTNNKLLIIIGPKEGVYIYII